MLFKFRMMRIHFLLHVHYEDPGYLTDWAENNGHSHSSTFLYDNEDLPGIEAFDFLVILGGPMNIYEETKYPWLPVEKKFIRKAIESGKKVLGICLGSQLIADVLGSKVYPNKSKEIGWFPVYKSEFSREKYTSHLEREAPALHWHGETFDLPAGADRLFSSEATINQGFAYENNVLALQFHWEVKRENIIKWLQFSGNDVKNTEKYVQTEVELLKDESAFHTMNANMDKLLFSFTRKM